MKTREQFPAMLQTLGLVGTAVEVGTYKADFAKWWLQHWPGQLVCVDAWRHYHGSPDILNHDDATMEAVYAEALSRLLPFDHRCVVIRDFSLNAAKKLTEAGEQFDCVYLDAAHDYDSVVADIAAWWPLVKPGGILSGHDYLFGTVEQGYPANFGVKPAVDEFVSRENLVLTTTTHDGSPTWWVFKANATGLV